MIDTETSSSETEHATVQLNWDLIDKLCARRGKITGADRAEFLGASRAQLYRWQEGTNDIGLKRAGDLASRLGLTLTEIVLQDPPPLPPPPPPDSPPAQPRPPAGPAGDRPPAGPREGQ